MYHGHSARALGAAAGGAGVQYVDTPTQEDALSVIVSLIGSGAQDAGMQALARAITAKAPARNDWAELTAIFYACKNGRPDLAPFGLQNGLRYMADARTDDQGGETDVFFAPPRVLTMLKAGQNGFDCDDQTMFVAALAKNCGFRVGARAYGEGDVAGFEHVYAVALIPKRGPWAEDAQGRIDESHVVGLDTTVPYATPGWQPPQGNVYTQLLP